MDLNEFDKSRHRESAVGSGADIAYDASGFRCLQPRACTVDRSSNSVRCKESGRTTSHSSQAVSSKILYCSSRADFADGSTLFEMSTPPRLSHLRWLAVRLHRKLYSYQCRARLSIVYYQKAVECWPWSPFPVCCGRTHALAVTDRHSNLRHGLHHSHIRHRNSPALLPTETICAAREVEHNTLHRCC